MIHRHSTQNGWDSYNRGLQGRAHFEFSAAARTLSNAFPDNFVTVGWHEPEIIAER
jgi:hypothetical protein